MVGGGVIGLAVAWRVASAGRAVTVVDPSPGRGASWAAAGMLGPVGEAHFGEDALTRLNVAAARAWPAFADELEGASGHLVHYRAEGTLLVAADASDRAAVDDVLQYQLALGLRARRLTSPQCRAAEPLLAPGVRAGVELADDHQVDNRQVVDALLAACRALSVSFVEDEVAEVTADTTGVTGVALRWGGRLDTGSVVLAAGCSIGPGGRCARSPPAPGSTGQGAHPPAPRPGWGAPSPAHPPGTGARTQLLPGAAARRHGGGGGHRRGEGIRPDRAGRVGGPAARRRPTAGTGDRRVRAPSRPPPDCARAHRTTPPSSGPPGFPVSWWPPATTATASCWPPSPPTRWSGLLEDRGGEGGFLGFGPDRFVRAPEPAWTGPAASGAVDR